MNTDDKVLSIVVETVKKLNACGVMVSASFVYSKEGLSVELEAQIIASEGGDRDG